MPDIRLLGGTGHCRGKRSILFCAGQVHARGVHEAEAPADTVDADDVRRMVQCPFPTYLIGVDEPNERAYVVSLHGKLEGPIASMPAKYPLNARNLRKLWDEV